MVATPPVAFHRVHHHHLPHILGKIEILPTTEYPLSPLPPLLPTIWEKLKKELDVKIDGSSDLKRNSSETVWSYMSDFLE